METRTILNGFFTGLLLQLAIGPVFLIILNITLENGFLPGFSAVFGVTLVDYLYIVFAIFGVGKLLESSEYKKVFLLISSSVLIVFGLMLVKKGMLLTGTGEIEVQHLTVLQSFGSTFILTASNPLTIVFWTSIFTTKAIEYSLTKRELITFGLSAGFATLSFLGPLVVLLSFFNKMIPGIVIRMLNVGVGLFLICFAIMRIKKDYKKCT